MGADAGAIRRVTRLFAGVVAGIAIGGSMSLAAPGTAAAATTRLVSPSGSDTVPANNPCTVAPCKTITHALAVAVSGDTISVDAGTYTERPVVTKGVTIASTAGAATTIVDGSNGGAVFSIQAPTGQPAVTISGLTIQHGTVNFGGGVQILWGNVVLTDDVITNNTATASFGGGGIGLDGTQFAAQGPTSLTATRVTISGNRATTAHGGGVYVAASATFTDSTITGNTAAGQGGGVYLNKVVAADTPAFTTVDTTGTAISGNTAAVGGGFAVGAGTMNLGPLASLATNTAVNGGGAYVAEAGAAVLDGTTVSGNKANGGAAAAGGNAGGIYNSGALTIKNHGTFTANQAVASTNTSNPIRGYGGAIFNASFLGGGPVLTMSDSTITGGLAAGQFNATSGGGIAQLSSVSATLTNDTLTGNVGFLGGAIYAGTSVAVNGSYLTANPAVVGGGVYVAAPTSAGAAFTMTGGDLSDNTAANGGGLYVVGKGAGANPGTATLDGVTVSGNGAAGGTSATGGNGGGIFNAGALAVRNASTLTGNYVKPSTASGAVTGYGGAIFSGPAVAGDAPTAAIVDSTISGGALPSGVTSNATAGGGIANVGNVFNITATPAPLPSVLTASRDTISSNVASLNGGGLYNGGSATLATVAFSGNSGAFVGGAIVDGSTIATDAPNLTATDVAVTGSSTPSFIGGGIGVLTHANLTMTGGSIASSVSQAGGGLYVQEGATATLDGTALTGNTATGANGGDGGGAFNAGSLTLRHSLVSGNQAVRAASLNGFGGGIYSGSNSASPATVVLIVDRSTLTNNTAAGGSGLLTLNKASAGTANSAAITNSTLTGNTVVGTASAGVVVAFHPMTITAATIDANTAAAGSGGIYGPATTVSGTILSANSGGSCGIAGGFVAPIDSGYNLSDPGDSSCGFNAANHDIAADPKLGPLANNGGPTPTQLPGPSSPVINAIPAGTTGLCEPGAVDQRDVARPQGAGCDIGAVETDLHAPTVAGPTTPTFTVGQAGSFSYTSTGVPTPQLSATGSLPAGVTFVDNGDGTATLAGTPAANTGGAYPITITATDGTAPDATLGVTVTVNQSPTIAGPASATYVVNNPGTPVTFTTTGYPRPTLTEAGSLPSGVTFTDNGDGTATLAGTPTTAGTFPITITATNGIAPDATLSFTLVVKPAVSIVTTDLPHGRVGMSYVAHLVATDGQPPYTWSVSSGELPTGLSLAPDGTISGTPAGAPVGTSTFTVMVQDGLNPAGVASRAFILVIDRGPSHLVVSPALIQTTPLGVNIGVARAVLTGGDPAVPLSGQIVVFKGGNTYFCQAITGADGVATCQINPIQTLILILRGGITAVYGGNALYEGTSAQGGLVK